MMILLQSNKLRHSAGLDQFKNKAELIMKLRHNNMVYCVHEEDKLLIYEFMSNGSLNKWWRET
jgi:hypothetical protein